MDMNKFIAAESSSDDFGNHQVVDNQEAPDKEMPDEDEDAAKPKAA